MAKKVLVVDDEKLIVKGIRFSLEQDGMEVDYAYDGESALEAAHEKKYDIILLDVMLPKMSGFEVVSRFGNFQMFRLLCLQQKATTWIRSLDSNMEPMITLRNHLIF